MPWELFDKSQKNLSSDKSVIRVSFDFKIQEVKFPNVSEEILEFSNSLVSVFLERGNKIAKTKEVRPVKNREDCFTVPLNESLAVTTTIIRSSSGVVEEKNCVLYVRCRRKGLLSVTSDFQTIGHATINLSSVVISLGDSETATFTPIPLIHENKATTTCEDTLVYAKISAKMAQERSDDCMSLASEASWLDKVQKTPTWILKERFWVRNLISEKCVEQTDHQSNLPSSHSETSSISGSNTGEDDSYLNEEAMRRATEAESRANSLEDKVAALRAKLVEGDRKYGDLTRALTAATRKREGDGSVPSSSHHDMSAQMTTQQVRMESLKAEGEVLSESAASGDDKFEVLLRQHVMVKVRLAAVAAEADEQRIVSFNLAQELQRYIDKTDELESAIKDLRSRGVVVKKPTPPPAAPPKRRSFFWERRKSTSAIPVSDALVSGKREALPVEQQLTFSRVLPPPSVSTRYQDMDMDPSNCPVRVCRTCGSLTSDVDV